MDLDAFLTQAIESGARALKEKKKKSKKKTTAPSRRRSKIKPEALELKKPRPRNPSFSNPRLTVPTHIHHEAVILRYEKRTCLNCSHTQIQDHPTIWLLSTSSLRPDYRRLEKVTKLSGFQALIAYLPLRTELHPTTRMCCKHCAKEFYNAQRTTSKRPSTSNLLPPPRPVHPIVLLPSRALPPAVPSEVLARLCDEILHGPAGPRPPEALGRQP